MRANSVTFSIARQTAWAPGLHSASDWANWAHAPAFIGDAAGMAEAPVLQLPAMLRRRAGKLGKMALQAGFECLGDTAGIPTVFCSRHGEVARAIELLTGLVQGEGVSPTGFGLSVHNASAGLMSIARAERASHIALSAGAATVEHGVIEACGLLADGAAQVLLVVYDAPLPEILRHFEDCPEQPFAFAWLMTPASGAADTFQLGWRASAASDTAVANPNDVLPGGLEVLRFQLSGAASMQRLAQARCWNWSRDA